MAPELALENLPGDERAAAIAHTEGCASCQELVTSLSAVTDRLLELAPTIEPDAGFESRVMAALAPPVVARRRPMWTRLATMAAAACLVVALTIAALGRSEPTAFAAADMRTATGDVVGQAFVRRASPTTVVLSLPKWADEMERNGWSTSSYALRVEDRAGGVETTPIQLGANATVTTTLDLSVGAIRTIALVDAHGYVWCEANLA
jgi:hypothetical protein